jgi:hypothetical protein
LVTGIGRRKTPLTATAYILFLAQLFEQPLSGDIAQYCQAMANHSSLLAILGTIVKEALKKNVYLLLLSSLTRGLGS